VSWKQRWLLAAHHITFIVVSGRIELTRINLVVSVPSPMLGTILGLLIFGLGLTKGIVRQKPALVDLGDVLDVKI
jgi:hypothetical protein